jgi:CRISPR-associated protein Csm1
LDEQLRGKVEKALIEWAVEALGRWAGVTGDLPVRLREEAAGWIAGYGQLLSRTWRPQGKGERLQSIFSLIRPPEGESVQPVFVAARPLSLETLLPDEADLGVTAAALWEGFAGGFGRLPAGDGRFETFIHLFYKYTWAVPCTYGEAGVSLYEEFKTLAALMYASGGAERPAAEFLLVGGDIPGIQDFVYTITSKGAAKGLRGRSFFIQLLGDAVVRRILADLELCPANVVYAAGGNFMVLAPAGIETVKATQRVRRQVNALLLEAFQGETALVLESFPVQVAELFTHGQFKAAREALGKRIAEAKHRPLAELATDWEKVFRPRGKGSDRACAVCRVEVDEQNSKPLEETGEVPEGTEPPRICYLCDSFGQLAHDIRHRDLWMVVREKREMLGTEVEPEDGWDRLLARMTGFAYRFSGSRPATGDTTLVINRTDFLQMGGQGFRLVANVTPVVTKHDVAYLRDEEKLEPRDMPHDGEIRSFTLLAHAAATAGAIQRVGVLRMDVDGLGHIFSEGVPGLTMPRLSALSGAVDLFFSGYLNVLVRAHGGNDLYVIYAGGDDLFIVGSWHHLPDLAEAICKAFKAFTDEHPALSLSGGITLEGARFPLYRAAERAGEAEGNAKRYVRQIEGREHRKDALCFLGQVVGWEKGEWDLVREQKDSLLWLIGEDEENRAKKEEERDERLHRALLQIIQSIHQLYRTGLRDARRQARRDGRSLPDPRMYLGRWAWMRVYSLARMARRSRHEAVPKRVEELQQAILRPEAVRLSGLAARWAEYLTRKAE